MHPSSIEIAHYDYHLPEERIARFPLAQRDESKLLVMGTNGLETSVYKHLGQWLPADNLMVFNDTRVVEARLVFTKPSGGQIEIFCLEHHAAHHSSTEQALAAGHEVYWQVMIGGLKKWKNKEEPLVQTCSTHQGQLILEVHYLHALEDAHLVRMAWNLPISFSEVLHAAGELPLPPYMNRKAEAPDAERYQTVYSKEEGSVAAPTAGLHFTQALLQNLVDMGQQQLFVTLHVGAGTFKPVKSATLADHPMHAEYIDVTVQALHTLATHTGPVTAVGTTSLRTLETLYWLGIQVKNHPDAAMPLLLDQWAPYQSEGPLPSAKESLQYLYEWMLQRGYHRLLASTRLLIAPGYECRVATGLVTNFHQPQSTLLVLVAAIAGPGWKKLYEYALENDFRFLSYGDGMYWQMKHRI